MRPARLDPLFAGPRSLPGVGEKTAEHLQRLCGERVLDLLYHAPVALGHRQWVDHLSQSRIGACITTTVTVQSHAPPPGRSGKRAPYRVTCQDAQGDRIDLVFFHVNPAQILGLLPIGEIRLISGRLDQYQSHWQMGHPDHIGRLQEKEAWVGSSPVYPLTYGLLQKQVHKLVQHAIARAPMLPEWIAAPRLQSQRWASWRDSLRTLHTPTQASALIPASLERQRLIYDELLANQLALILARAQRHRRPGRAFSADNGLLDPFLKLLPFELTGAQKRVIAEIGSDMSQAYRMIRLVQGDVGSGKTVVAMAAMLQAVACGAQAALLAPTEILAQQHAKTIGAWAQQLGLRAALLTGSTRQKEALYADLKSGALQIVVGTHALIQDSVMFKDLGIVVIDEQHRFGVEQRATLSQKGAEADVLVMTATPIPRTLMLAQFGDLDISVLDEKPAGRQDIVTTAMPHARLNDVVAGLQRALQDQRKVYWVCPLVEASEALDLACAQERFEALEKEFPGQVVLLHGRMKPAEKEAAMAAFVAPGPRILVATTVIEVGVDVPQATVMVIEHAERFGLSQLHQLRGRVGRGAHASACVLLYGPHLSETARARLQVMRQSNDGFRIAQEDLRLRGGGESLGARQSGLPQLKLAEFPDVQDLVMMAHQDAQDLLSQDPQLTSDRGRAARILLYLYNKDRELHMSLGV